MTPYPITYTDMTPYPITFYRYGADLLLRFSYCLRKSGAHSTMIRNSTYTKAIYELRRIMPTCVPQNRSYISILFADHYEFSSSFPTRELRYVT